MKTKKVFGFILCIIYGLSMLLVGCTNQQSSSQNNTSVSLKTIIDLSPSNISSIKLSQDIPTSIVIDNPEQINQVCSFLSSITVDNKYTDEDFLDIHDINTPIGGNFGTCYIIITYSNDTVSHIEIYANDMMNQVQISGWTSQEEIKDKWQVYPLVYYSEEEQIKQEERLKEILSMEPVS